MGTDTHRGMKENAERGFVNGGRTPYGYRIAKVEGNNGEGHGRLVPGPEQEVAVVREVFELAVQKGMGCRQIINVLNRRGEPAPNGPHWTVGTVNFMLNNRVYVGDTIWGKTRKKGREQRQRNAPERQTLVENTHAPLIDRAVFEERARHARARPFTAPASPASPTVYLLTRLLRCDHCKSTWSVQRQNYKDKDGNKRTRIAYYCNGYLSKGKEVCPSLPIPVAWADRVVLDVLRAHLCDPATLATLDEQAQARIQTLREKYGTDGRALRQQLAALDQRIARYIDAIGAGVDIKVCQAEIEKARARKAAVEAQAEVIQHEDYCTTALEKNRAQVARFAEALRGDFTRLPMPVQRRVLLYFIRDLAVVDRKELVIETIVPFDNAGLDQLLDEIETVEAAEQVEGVAADQELSFSDRFDHGGDDLKWLRLLDITGTLCMAPEGDELVQMELFTSASAAWRVTAPMT